MVYLVKKEMDEKKKPPIHPVDVDIEEYDTVLLGTPVWWGTMATPLYTWLSDQDLAGKTLGIFSTHGGGGLGNVEKDIQALFPEAVFLETFVVKDGGGESLEKDLREWIQ